LEKLDQIISIDEVAEMFSIPRSTYRLNKLSDDLDKVDMFDKVIVDKKKYYQKKQILNLIENYISKAELCNHLNLKIGRVEELIKEFSIPVIEIGYNISLKFINKDNVSILRNKRNTKENIREKREVEMQARGLVSLRLLRERLNIHHMNKRLTNQIIKEYDIELLEHKSISCVLLSDQEFLIQSQKELLNHYKNNYCDSQQAKKLLKGELNYTISLDKLIVIPVPILLKPYYPNAQGLYDIKSIKEHQKIIQKADSYKEIRAISNQDITSRNAYDVYYDSIDCMDQKFSENKDKTIEMWNEYVRIKLSNSRARDLKHLISKYINAFVSLASNINKEIYYYSASELNQIIFNDLLKTHQLYIYDFCNVVYESFRTRGIKVFDFYHLNDPSKIAGNVVQQDLSRYSLKEYQHLFDYCIQLEYHKMKAIKDIEGFLCGERYLKYDSSWLYVMTHLTNNWRHSTIIDNLPRVSLNRTRVTSLSWFEKNDLSIEEANDIIYQIGRYQVQINKNESEGLFNVSEPLKISFATAVCICELRNQLSFPDSKGLLWFGPKERFEQGSVPIKDFFKKFNGKFKFSNRKMNRTLSTLIWSIFKNIGVGLDAAKVSRGHYQENTTKKYIKLTDNELEELINDVFDRGKFGYAYNLLSNIVFGQVSERGIETPRILAIRKRFGEISKLEATAGLMNRIIAEEKDLEAYLSSLTLNQAKEMYYNCLSNTLYSKEKHYQCVFSSCKYPDRDCSDCPFSIANVYTLSNLLDDYVFQINYIISNFESAPLGEKKRMANQFFLLYNKVYEAREQFGDETVYSFIEGGKKRLKQLALRMPKTKSYITIKN
jgi:hypothetical protein